MNEAPIIQWQWGIVAAVSMILLSLYPQVHFRISRGAQWNGSYAAIEGVGDEVAYSAYVNALMDRRPRRNDPYSGRDDVSKNRQPESLFSIQFIPAYLIAFAARAFGVSASTAFIVLTPLAAGAASLALFWLLAMTSGDDRVAATGTIVVLCLGTVVGGHGLFAGLFGGEPLYNYLMFLRRYQPSAAFPLFLLYFAVVWRTLKLRNRVAARATAIGAGIIFGLLVFSYVYLWTAATAWLGSLIVFWVTVRPPAWRESLKSLGLIAIVSLAALIPFAIMYGQRASSLDAVQALEHTHRPDLLRLPELVSIAALLMLAWLIRRGAVPIRDLETLFAASFALLPILVLNQQVISGRSLQPLHYEMFVANYSALISFVLIAALVRKLPVSRIKIRRRALVWIAIAAFEWGAYETFVATRRSMEFDRRLDDSRAVALRLKELSPLEEKRDPNVRPTVLSSDLLAADGLPTSAPQAVLWAPHLLVFSGVTDAESKERFYQYLYYTGIGPERLCAILSNEGQYGFAAGLFGFERTIKGLSVNPKPITHEELQSELAKYAEYCATFNQARAQQTELSYLVVSAGEERHLSNFDRWYERDRGERIGNYTLYRVSLRDCDAGLNAQTPESSQLR